MTGNLKQWIEESAGGEPIEAVVIGRLGWFDDEETDKRGVPQSKKGTLLTWQEAAPLLDYQFDNGFGSVDCHAICAWTASRVIFISQYDGATSDHWVPRYPVAHMPDMPGG